MALEIGGPVSPRHEFTRQDFWVGLGIVLLVAELAVVYYLYRKIGGTPPVIKKEDRAASNVPLPVELSTLTPPATTSARTEKVSLQSLTPPPTPPSSFSPQEEQAILHSLSPQ